jgi:hypothetical protein
MSSISPLQLFKSLSDETRLGIVLLLKEMGELCVCDLCTALEQSQLRSPVIDRCYVKADCCWIARMGNGFTTAYLRIFLAGLLRRAKNDVW